jgi:hypothetical protein
VEVNFGFGIWDLGFGATFGQIAMKEVYERAREPKMPDRGYVLPNPLEQWMKTA